MEWEDRGAPGTADAEFLGGLGVGDAEAGDMQTEARDHNVGKRDMLRTDHEEGTL